MTPERAAQFMARRQLLREPIARGAAALGDRWPTALDSLRLASLATQVVLVGPVACVLRGYPGAIPEARVGLMGRWSHQGSVLQQLMDAGAMQVGFDTAPRGYASRERWLGASGAAVTVGWLLADRHHEVDALQAVSTPLVVPGGGTLWLPEASALQERAAASRWPADNELVPGLEAVVRVERAGDPPPRPSRWIVLDEAGSVADRSVRAEHVGLTIPFAGELPADVRRSATTSFKQLVVRPGEPRTLRGAELSAGDAAITVTAAAAPALLDDWLVSGDLVAAVDFALEDAYRAAASRT